MYPPGFAVYIALGSTNAARSSTLDLARFGSYTKCVRIDFDPTKDKLNLASHGLSLAFAKQLAWDEALVWVDERFEYDELRMIGLVPEGSRLYYVAFVDRGKTRRVISLRLAERREVKHYVENYP
jgi:uncharacterized DUF497 family protein